MISLSYLFKAWFTIHNDCRQMVAIAVTPKVRDHVFADTWEPVDDITGRLQELIINDIAEYIQIVGLYED